MLLTNSKHSLSITGHWLGSNRWAVSCERQQWSDNKITCSLERRRISSKFESLVCLLISGVVSLWWFYMVSWIIHAFWSILNYDRLENRCMEMSPLTCLLFFICYIKQVDYMFPCVCTVIGHRRRQNLIKTSVTHSAVLREPLTCIWRLLSAIPLQMHGNTESIC